MAPLSHAAVQQPSIAANMATGHSILQAQQELQNSAIRMCQINMFNTQHALLQSEVQSLIERFSALPSGASTAIIMSSYTKADAIERKLAELGSWRQTYIGNLTTANAINEEFRKTEGMLNAIATNLRDARQNLTRKESTIQVSFGSNPQFSRNYLEKLSLPAFSGKVADYPSFRQRFKDLTANEGYPNSVVVEHLKNATPKDCHHIVEGSSSPEEAWARLDEKFGDATMTVVTVQTALLNLDLNKYREYDRVERLYDEISRALRLLAPLKAENALARDIKLVSRLVEKLPDDMQIEWS